MVDDVLEVPTSLSPSRVEKFLSCPLAFRFATVEKLPERPSIHTTRGSLVHRALELAYARPAAERTPDAFRSALDVARREFHALPDVVDLGLDDAQLATLDEECRVLVEHYLALEDPTTVRAIGLELRLAADVGDLQLRGVIDRLDLRDDGELVVVDYKSGRAPSVSWEQRSLSGVHFYAFLCEQVLGRRPAAVRLMYLSSGEVIEARPSAQSTRFVPTRAQAIWQAVELAVRTDDFRPRPSSLCAGCSFQAWCPAFGGDPARAALEAAEPQLVATALR
jgi:putative RecB family exonuclease